MTRDEVELAHPEFCRRQPLPKLKHILAACVSLCIVCGLASLSRADDDIPPNTWVAAKPAFQLPDDIKDARWLTGDGYSDNVYRAKTGTILIRTGIESKSMGFSPGFYTNTTVEWDLKTDRARVLDISNWGGGSYSPGQLLPGFKDHPTPMPRHTYDGICYVEDEDAVYLMLGAHGRSFSKTFDDDTRAAYRQDVNSTWKLSPSTGRWTRIPESVRKFWNESACSPYESHLQHWPDKGKLLFFNDLGTHAAEFDLKTQKWEKATAKNKPPMSLYNARSTWDSKRQRWIFRLGPRLCSYDPREREFKQLPTPYERGEDKKDPGNSMKGITYIPKHDVYLISGPTAADTWVYAPEKGTWSQVKASGPKLIAGYLQYDPRSDQVILSYQLTAFRFRYEPNGKEP